METRAAEGSHGIRERAHHESEFGRIVSFTDGVLAIAITLLVLFIEVPQVPARDLPRGLLDQTPELLAYALSFAVIGRYWVVHHRFFARLARFDDRLMTYNLLFLSLIVLIPFASELLGQYGNEPTAPMAYAAIVGAAALVAWLMARHAVILDLVTPEERARAAHAAEPRALLIAGVFFASMPVALLSPLAAELMWAALLVARSRHRVPGRR